MKNPATRKKQVLEKLFPKTGSALQEPGLSVDQKIGMLRKELLGSDPWESSRFTKIDEYMMESTVRHAPNFRDDIDEAIASSIYDGSAGYIPTLEEIDFRPMEEPNE